jgi:hypothetical protein
MRYIPVPHFGQTPFMAKRVLPPLPFIVTSFASFISLLALHFTQYPSIFLIALTSGDMVNDNDF